MHFVVIKLLVDSSFCAMTFHGQEEKRGAGGTEGAKGGGEGGWDSGLRVLCLFIHLFPHVGHLIVLGSCWEKN